jgi:predicted dehydrogenase
VLRGAISGFGEVAAQAHLAGWLTRPEIAIVAIHDPVAARRHMAINLLRHVRVYDDLDLMLDGEALDFVDIASPPAFHVAAARNALAAGAHVLVEKPACLIGTELAELEALAAERSRILMCVHNWKHAPAYRRAHELIAAGRLGDLRFLSLVRLRSGPAGVGGAGGGEPWRLNPKSGGGILIDHGWHVFYLMHWLMGGVAPPGISALLGKSDRLSLDDLADLRIEFPNGRLAHAHLSWRSPARRTSAVIYGANAMLEIERNRMVLTERSGGTQEDLSVSDIPDDSYHAAWFAGVAIDFERAIAEGCDGVTVCENRDEVRAAVALTEASARSAEASGTRISIGR